MYELNNQGQNTSPADPAVDPQTGLISRVPGQEELLAHGYGVPPAVESAGSKATALDKAATQPSPETQPPLRHSAASVGQPGPNTPWGPSTCTGDYRKLDNGDLSVMVVAEGDSNDPMDGGGRVAWVNLTDVESGTTKWQVSGFPGSLTIDVPAVSPSGPTSSPDVSHYPGYSQAVENRQDDGLGFPTS